MFYVTEISLHVQVTKNKIYLLNLQFESTDSDSSKSQSILQVLHLWWILSSQRGEFW